MSVRQRSHGRTVSALGARLCRVQQRAIRVLPVLGVCLCICNQSAYADTHTDAVDRLLISAMLPHRDA